MAGRATNPRTHEPGTRGPATSTSRTRFWATVQSISWVPGPSILIDSIDDEPSMHRFYRRLRPFSRVIRLDFRGTGLSSNIPSREMLGPRYWAEDALAVLDAVGSRQVSILAPSYAAMTGVLIAADFPDRVRSLVIVNGVARTLRAPDYPIGADPEAAAPFMQDAMELDAVERGMDVLRVVAHPSPTTTHSGRGGTWPATGRPRRAWREPSVKRSPMPMSERRFHEFQRRLWYCTARMAASSRQRSAAGIAENISGARYVELPGGRAVLGRRVRADAR